VAFGALTLDECRHVGVFVAGKAGRFLPASVAVGQKGRLPPRACRRNRIDLIVIVRGVVIVGGVIIICRIIIGRLGARIVVVIAAADGKDAKG
jgi:hypothetical protein